MKHVIPHVTSPFWRNFIRVSWMIVFGAGALSLADHIGHYGIVAHIAVLDHGLFGYIATIGSLIFAALYFGFRRGRR